jgi:hypothetical protein
VATRVALVFAQGLLGQDAVDAGAEGLGVQR